MQYDMINLSFVSLIFQVYSSFCHGYCFGVYINWETTPEYHRMDILMSKYYEMSLIKDSSLILQCTFARSSAGRRDVLNIFVYAMTNG
jgi:hypothetical protein